MVARSTAVCRSVEEYISSQPEAVRNIVKQVCDTIRKALPEAEEAISYKIPAYRIPAGPVVYFAVWKKHYSLYPASAKLVDAFKDELAPYVIGKGTIRFPISQPVPLKLIRALARFRAHEVAERAERKRAQVP